MKKIPTSLWSFFLLLVLGVSSNADELEGYWKYTEESIQQITDYTLEARRTGKSTGTSTAAEISSAYRNHLRQFKKSDGNRIHIQLIQFERNDDPYPEYYRDFHFDYTSEGNQFSIKQGERDVFTGHIENGTLHLKDANAGTVVTMLPVSAGEMPTISDGNSGQAKLDRQPRPRKMVTPDYPANLERQGIGGVVSLSFYVNTDGSTSEIRVLSSPHPGLERAAIDAILESTFHPGKSGRDAVRTHVKLPITFR